MPYTSEEVTQAVEKLVTSSIRRPVDTLGVRRPDVTFVDVQEAAAGAFILYPLSPFYVVLLGSRRLVEELREEAGIVGELRAAVGAIGRRVLPVETVETLFNAAAALGQLEVAVSDQAPKDITKLPAFQRFALNVQDFLLTEGSKVKEAGDIVPTPQEARALVPGLVRQLLVAHAALVERVTALSSAIVDYNSVNLPSLVARGVVSKAREVLSDHAQSLDALQPEERLTSLRSVILDVLTAKSVVQKFGSTGGFTTFVPMSGTGQPFSDATRLSTPATKTSDFAAPFIIYQGADQLRVTMDGGFEDTIVLNSSLIAQLNGIRAEVVEPGGTGFIIGDGTSPVLPDYPPPDNNQLKLQFSSLVGGPVTTVTVPLTLSTLAGPNAVPRTAQQICDNINTALTSAGLNTQWLAEPYFFPANFIGTLDITVVAGATADFTVPFQTAANLSFVKIGDLVEILAGPNAGLWTVTVLNSLTSIRAVKAIGVATTESLRDLQVGDPKRALRIRAISPSTQILNEAQIAIFVDSDKNTLGAGTLGLNRFGQAFCRPTTGQQVADDLTQKLPKKLVGSAIVVGTELSWRTEPGTFLTLVSSKLQTLGNITYTPGGPNAIDILIPGGGLLAAGVIVGDVVVLRGGTPPGTTWTITSLTDSTCHATSVQTAINGAGVSIEFGTPVTATRWRAINIPAGVLEGRYYVQKQGTSGLDLVLFSGLNAMQDPATHLPLLATGTYGEEKVVISSRSEQVSSSIAVNASSTAIAEFFSTPVATAFGTSPWFQLPQLSHAVDTGDRLEIHASTYHTPSNEYAITSVSGRIIGISPQMPSNESWNFNDQPPPFARIRNGVNLNFAEYKTLLDAWLVLDINQTNYFRDLNRFLNPLLQNATPTAEQVGTALNHIQMLLDYLLIAESDSIPDTDTLEGAVAFYSVDVVPTVDTLIKSFTEKGADRAVDLLLEGRFATFFGMEVADTSYSSFMQKGMREVMQNDLPIRSTRRLEANQSRVRSIAESPDFEFTVPDDVGPPDVPADFDDTPR